MSNEYEKAGKIGKNIGLTILIIGGLLLIINLFSVIKWNIKKGDYTEQYVYSDNGELYYEANGQKTYIQKMYDTDGEIYSGKIPDNKVIIMWINNENNNEGVYFDLNKPNDQIILEPLKLMITVVILGCFGTFILLSSKEKPKDVYKFNPLSVSLIFPFVAGIILIIVQLNNAFNYLKIKSENNIATATIYSEMYNMGSLNNNKSVSYYYVDNQKYLYVNDTYERGKIEKNLGKTFEVYYDENNPSKAYKKGKMINGLLFGLGVFFIISITYVWYYIRKQHCVKKQK